MRLDKYLKVSRLIKRRTVAAEAASSGRIEVNGRVVKPACDVKEGDNITISLGNRKTFIKVLKVCDFIKAENAESMYEIIDNTNEKNQ